VNKPLEAVKRLRRTRLIFALTPGRSGSKLLAHLLANLCDVQAEHEAAPRLNFVLRAVQAAPESARWWLFGEKLPAIADRLDGRPYADISHLYCKGFVEPLLQMRLKPDFIILTRPAREVASSMMAIGSIPERTSAGRLVLIGPSDPGVVVPESWREWSDYQLCFWYAREIERRQRYYELLLPDAGCRVTRISLADLTDFARFRTLAQFVTGKPGFRICETAYKDILSVNRNPRSAICNANAEAVMPADLAAAENIVDTQLAAL
jgi:hypothetical protein